jgi:hypothetical protein
LFIYFICTSVHLFIGSFVMTFKFFIYLSYKSVLFLILSFLFQRRSLFSYLLFQHLLFRSFQAFVSQVRLWHVCMCIICIVFLFANTCSFNYYLYASFTTSFPFVHFYNFVSSFCSWIAFESYNNCKTVVRILKNMFPLQIATKINRQKCSI